MLSMFIILIFIYLFILNHTPHQYNRNLTWDPWGWGRVNNAGWTAGATAVLLTVAREHGTTSTLPQLLEENLYSMKLPFVPVWVDCHPDCIIGWDILHVVKDHGRRPERSDFDSCHRPAASLGYPLLFYWNCSDCRLTDPSCVRWVHVCVQLCLCVQACFFLSLCVRLKQIQKWHEEQMCDLG